MRDNDHSPMSPCKEKMVVDRFSKLTAQDGDNETNRNLEELEKDEFILWEAHACHNIPLGSVRYIVSTKMQLSKI